MENCSRQKIISAGFIFIVISIWGEGKGSVEVLRGLFRPKIGENFIKKVNNRIFVIIRCF